jgi:hypothetical protein
LFKNSDRDGLVDIEQLFKLAKASEHCLKVAEEKIASDQAVYFDTSIYKL